MNFIINLFSSKRAISVYDACFVIVNRCTKMTLYILVTKKIIVVDLIEMIFDYVILKFEIFKNVVFNKTFVFINAY